MKRAIAIVLTGLLVAEVGLNETVTEINNESNTKEIVDTTVLSYEDYSLLYSYKNEVINDTCLSLSTEDAQRLMRIAVVEDSTSIESQAMIMKTVLNRVESEYFPNTVEEVIFQKNINGTYAFSTVANGSYQRAVPNIDSHLALAMVEGNWIETEALFFEAEWAENTWQSINRDYLETVGGTKFYK